MMQIKGVYKMNIPTIPDWCNGLPGTTRITSAEILEFFGYRGKSSNVGVYLSRGSIPEPIISKDGSVGRMNRRNKYWLLGDIRKLRLEMLNEHTNKKD